MPPKAEGAKPDDVVSDLEARMRILRSSPDALAQWCGDPRRCPEIATNLMRLKDMAGATRYLAREWQRLSSLELRSQLVTHARNSNFVSKVLGRLEPFGILKEAKETLALVETAGSALPAVQQLRTYILEIEEATLDKGNSKAIMTGKRALPC